MPEPISAFNSLDEIKKSADSVKDLLQGKTDDRLRTTLQKLYDEGKICLEKGDKERAYILFMRCMNVYSILSKRTDFKKHKQFYKDVYGKILIDSQVHLEELDKYLRNEFERRQRGTAKEKAKETNLIIKEIRETPEKNGLTPVIKNGYKDTSPHPPFPPEEQKKYITPPEMYVIMKKNVPNSLLVIDVRLKVHFEASSIIVKDIINIPEDIIEAGCVVSKLENLLEEKFIPYFKRRSEYDNIVIMDWFTSECTFVPSCKIDIMRNALIKWDVKTKYKSCPVILNGGFEQWHACYPNLTTDSKIVPPERHRKDSKIKLESIMYPTKDFFDNNGAEVKPDITVTGTTLQRDVLRPAIDRSTKPTLNDKKTDANSADMKQSTDPIPSIENKMKLLELSQNHTNNNLPDNNVAENNKKEKQTSIESEDEEDHKSQYYRSSSGRRSAVTSASSYAPIVDNHTAHYETDDEDLSESYKNEEDTENHVNLLKTISNAHNDVSSGMKRYSSTPNISKVGNSEYSRPPIDRSTKPSSNDDQFYSTNSYVYDTERRGLTGLVNVGNTCYMNSIIQCLSNTKHLRQYLFNGGISPINPKSKTRGRIAKEVNNIILQLWSKKSPVSCKTLKNIVGEYRDSFRGSEQQDSHEFLTILIDWLHEDLNRPSNEIGLQGADEKSGEKAWGEFRSKNNSIIRELFYGQQKSTVSCSVCEKQSVTFEPFSNLSLPLPAAEKCTLVECLKLYTSNETISGWQCPECKCQRSATKKLDITRLPPHLVIHFKRFTSDGWCRKRLTYVDFPDMLDMTQHIIGDEHRFRKYELYAISNHIGSMETGHYTAFCRNSNNWYKYDDEQVTSMSSAKKSPAAYIVFYQSMNNF